MENDKKDMNDNILVVNNLKKYYPVSRLSFGTKAFVKAVDDVSLSIKGGTTMGLVGGLAVVRLPLDARYYGSMR